MRVHLSNIFTRDVGRCVRHPSSARWLFADHQYAVLKMHFAPLLTSLCYSLLGGGRSQCAQHMGHFLEDVPVHSLLYVTLPDFENWLEM